MAHCYASVATFKDFIKDSGSASSGGLGTVNDALFLTWLEDASRAIDTYCDRTGPAHPMSGFGPRIGTNRYDGPLGVQPRNLGLEDDLLAITAVTAMPAPGATPITYTDETDFFKKPFDRAPYRELELMVPLGLQTWYGVRRGVSVSGTWGYANDPVLSTTTVASGLSVGTTATTFTTSASPTISPGNTLLVGTENLYLTALAGTGATIDRGANGTTPAAHVDASAISVYRYDRRVTRTCLALALRRWRMRDTGMSGMVGGGPTLPGYNPPDPSDLAIMRNGLTGLALATA